MKGKCIVCGKDATTVCSVCKRACYCSRSCQKRDWDQHKLVCNKLQKDYSNRDYVTENEE